MNLWLANAGAGAQGQASLLTITVVSSSGQVCHLGQPTSGAEALLLECPTGFERCPLV